MASKARLGEVLKMWGAVLGRRVETVLLNPDPNPNPSPNPQP